MKVLCVDNQVEDVAVLTYMLEGIGYEVITATNGDQAGELLRKQSIDGVLVDYNLPGASGAAVRAQLKAMRPDVPVLIFEGVGNQTPPMLRFFDSYLRNAQWFEDD